jgi:stage V sporulation protein G
LVSIFANVKVKSSWKQVVDLVEVTDVRLRKVNKEGRMRAIASITIDSEFVVHDLRVIDGNNGLFVAMPSKRTPDGEFRDIAHPISPVSREKIEAAVLEVYRRIDESESLQAQSEKASV